MYMYLYVYFICFAKNHHLFTESESGLFDFGVKDLS